MTLLARKRGLGTLIYLVIRGFRRGDPVTIGITIAVVLAIIGYMVYSSRKAAKQREEAEFGHHFRPPSDDANHSQ